MIEVILAVVGIYLGLGVLFAVPFALIGAGSLDPAARSGSRGFKLIIIPGAAVFWPVLALRWWLAAARDRE